MIIVGYQGIGKSTAAKQGLNLIDLESGSFWIDHGQGARSRDKDWYIVYCNIAQHLSAQGYDVFVSSHKEVRDQLKNSTQDVVAIFPDKQLKNEWIARLQERYNNSKLDKDYRALMNAKERFTQNIEEIEVDCPNHIKITHMKYDLILLIHQYHREHGV